MVVEEQTPPLVSVILPIRNEEKAIQRTLNSVIAQDYPRDRLEILVADGMSDDATRSLVSDYAARDQRIRIVDNPGRIMVTGFNTALGFSRGEIIIMAGGHTELARDYVHNCVRLLAQGPAECVGGPIETVPNSPEASAIALAMSSPFGVGGVAFRSAAGNARYVDTVAFGAYTRRVIERAGPLDEEMVRNQDDEYNYRLRKLGAKILLSPSVRSRYYSRSTLRALWRQYFQYGFWKVRVLQKHPGQMQPRQFVPPLFVASCLISLLLAPFAKLGLWLCAAALGPYLIANLGWSIVTARKSNWRLLPLLFLTFATLHISYGLGFLLGISRFWNRWSFHAGEER